MSSSNNAAEYSLAFLGGRGSECVVPRPNSRRANNRTAQLKSVHIICRCGKPFGWLASTDDTFSAGHKLPFCLVPFLRGARLKLLRFAA